MKRLMQREELSMTPSHESSRYVQPQLYANTILKQKLGRCNAALRSAVYSVKPTPELFDGQAQAFDRHAGLQPAQCCQTAATVLELGDVGAAELIVEVGAGTGQIGYEAIRNAYAHSRGSHLKVELTYGKDLALRVCDDGIGIDPAASAHGKPGHFGLQGMHERASRIGTELTIVSSPAYRRLQLRVALRRYLDEDGVLASRAPSAYGSEETHAAVLGF